jgi:hypothetical protein
MNDLTILLTGTLLALIASRGVEAQPSARVQVPDIKPLLLRAIEQGSAQGVLVGVAAAYTQRKFGTTSPIEIDVRRLQALPNPGCARLEVTTRQKDVVERGQKDDRELVYQVSYCRDGSVPDKR